MEKAPPNFSESKPLPAVLMRLHWIYAVQSFSCSTSADTSARYASVAVMTAVPSL